MLETKKVSLEEWVPHFYQEQAIDFVLTSFEREGSSALFLDPGLGKTSTTLEIFKRLKAAGKVKRMLVIAPLRVAQLTWPDEISKWLNFFGLTYTVLHGSDKEAKLKQDKDIYIMNYEGIPWLSTQNWAGADMLVMDELTRLKAWGKKKMRSNALKPFLPTFKYRLGLTGTPIPNGYIDLFGQVFMLDMGKRFGKSITTFKKIHFIPENPFNLMSKLIPIEGVPNRGVEFINNKLLDLAYRIDGKDWVKLPTEIHSVIELELPPKLKAQYKALKEEFILHLNEIDVISATTAGILSTKLRQFLSGNVYLENQDFTLVHNEKYNALKDFVEDNEGKPLFIAYNYKHELITLQKMFPKAEFITSGMGNKQLKDIVDRWNTGKVPQLFGHPKSIAHGLNLQGACNNVAFFTLDFNLDEHQQFIKRVARQGQKEDHVFVYYFVFKNTIEQYILSVLNGKASVQNALLDFIKNNG